jgi:hypothetical protein
MDITDTNNAPEEPLVPPVLDEAELIGNASTDFPVIEAEPEEELDLPLDTVQQQRLLVDGGDGRPAAGPPLTLPGRPGLQRGNSVPTSAPLHLPPPAPPAPSGPPPDALAQLQNLVQGLPKADPAPYAFTYDDASSFAEELEEWFSYAVEEQAMLLKAQASFALEWSTFNGLNDISYEEGGLDWARAADSQHKGFIAHLLQGIRQQDPVLRLKRLEALVYVLLGCWHETAGLAVADPVGEIGSGRTSRAEPARSTMYEHAGQQAALIKRNVHLLVDSDGLRLVVDVLRSSLLRTCGVDVAPEAPRDGKEAERREVWCAMTAVYVVLEVARIEEKESENLSLRGAMLNLEKPGLLMFLVDVISKLRWDESISLPLSKVSLLLWKAMLVCFGGLAEVAKAKESFRDQTLESEDSKGQPLITASPLDYHLFRQEISSKYPAYNPRPTPLSTRTGEQLDPATTEKSSK